MASVEKDFRWDLQDTFDELWDLLYDGGMCEAAEELDTKVEWMMEELCGRSGHRPVDDHCGKPEHRSCLYCHTMTPHQSVDGSFKCIARKEDKDELRHMRELERQLRADGFTGL